jgi:HPr kinase/phosphorylase
MKSVTVRQLFEIHAERLELEWLAGRAGRGRRITSEGVETETSRVVGDDIIGLETRRNAVCKISPNKSLVGHLNLIHPNQVQVLGYTEIRYLTALRDISRKDAIRQLLNHEPDCVIVAEAQPVPAELVKACDETATPLFSSGLSSNKLTDDLHYYLSNLLAKMVTLHGVYMEVITIGALLIGESGVGKSELALELITRGHRLVADDAPEFSLIAPDTINGTCPKALTDFLEVRGLGIINVRELFGAGAVKRHKFLRLILRLERLDQNRLINLDRLEGSYRAVSVLGLEIPEITLPVAPGRNLAVLVECAARNHILRMSGYNASEDFMERQRRLMDKEPG